MKKTIITLVALTSLSTFAGDSFRAMPKGALRTGNVSLGSYEFLKVVYDERDGFKPRANQKVKVEISDVNQERDSRYIQYVGQMGSENLGRATNVNTSLKVRVIEGSDTFGCTLSSSALDDGMDSIGYNDAELSCRVDAGKKSLLIVLKDYSENRVNAANAHYELFISYQKSGFFGTKKSFSAEIKAN